MQHEDNQHCRCPWCCWGDDGVELDVCPIDPREIEIAMMLAAAAEAELMGDAR